MADVIAVPGVLLPSNPTQSRVSRETPPQLAAVFDEAIANLVANRAREGNATAIAMADYLMEDAVAEINRAAAEIARRAADRQTQLTPDRPRFVAGVLGPTNRTASISPDVNDPGYRNVGFDALVAAYGESVTALQVAGVFVALGGGFLVTRAE